MMSAILEIESTKAKARFASLPGQAKTRDVAITRHGHIQAYVLSPERYAHLSSVDRVGVAAMQNLEADFAGLVARMQSATHAQATERLATAPLETILAETKPDQALKKSRKGKKHA